MVCCLLQVGLPDCHAQAPVMDTFNKWYGMDVLSIKFLMAKALQDIRNLSLTMEYPCLYQMAKALQLFRHCILVSRDKKNVVPLGAGTMSVEQIAERIHRVIDKKPQHG